MAKKEELTEEEKALKAKEEALLKRHASAKASGAMAVIIIDFDGVDKVIYCKEPHRKITGLWQIALEKDMLEANFNLVKGSAIPELSDMDIFTNPSNDTYIAISSEAGTIAQIIQVKKSTSLIL